MPMKDKTNFSAGHKKYLAGLKRRKIAVSAMRWGLLAAVIALWELLAKMGVIDSFITSCPSRIWDTFLTLCKDGSLFEHAGVTLFETVVSFLIATVAGTLIAIALWWCDTLRNVLEPHLVVLNALPKIALGPVIIIWVGAGTGAIIVMALMISLIITVLSTLNGFLEVDKGKITLLDTMNATKLQKLIYLVLPSNVPTIISALKINVGLCWVGTIMGEYLVSRAGLGYLIIYGGQVFKLDLVMTSTVVLCVLAALMYAVVALLEKLVNKKFGKD